jgi:hypothetical protein
MTKGEKISTEAEAAETVDQLWSLFITEEMLDKMVLYTNQSIAEEVENLQYSTERLRKSPYIRPIDKVCKPLCPHTGIHPCPYFVHISI